MRISRTECLLLLLTWLTTASLAQDPLPKNCFSFVDESQWSRVLGFNSTSASLSVLVEGAGSSVQTCLRYTFIQSRKSQKLSKLKVFNRPYHINVTTCVVRPHVTTDHM